MHNNGSAQGGDGATVLQSNIGHATDSATDRMSSAPSRIDGHVSLGLAAQYTAACQPCQYQAHQQQHYQQQQQHCDDVIYGASVHDQRPSVDPCQKQQQQQLLPNDNDPASWRDQGPGLHQIKLHQQQQPQWQQRWPDNKDLASLQDQTAPMVSDPAQQQQQQQWLDETPVPSLEDQSAPVISDPIQQQQRWPDDPHLPSLPEQSATVDSYKAQQGQQQQQNAWREVIGFALPMLATLAADPLASLVDTAYVGHLGPAQLAGVGMASNIFTSITRLFNAPLLAVTTSTVAAAAAAAVAPAAAAATDVADPSDDISNHSSSSSSRGSTDLVIVLDPESPKLLPAAAAAAAAGPDQPDLEQPLLDHDCSTASSSDHKQQQQQCHGLSAAVSAAIWLAFAFSIVQVAVFAAGCESLVSIWGAPPSSPLYAPTQQFLFLRGLAAPVTVLLLVLQGVFRGLKDASTPFYATLACSLLNIALEPAFIFKPLHLGVRGSALATALAQTVPLIALFVVLQRKYELPLKRLLTNGIDWHSLGAMFAPTGFLLLRTISISAVFATATSLVARSGPLAAAAHQVAFQIWLASSLLADSLAVACQTLLARSIAAGQLRYGRKIVVTAIVTATTLGVLLSIALGAGMHVIPNLFTQDPSVLKLTRSLMPIVAFTQPLNALAFVLDGVLYGAGGFKYASAVMLLCASPSLGLMFAGQYPRSADQTPPHAFSPAAANHFRSRDLDYMHNIGQDHVLDQSNPAAAAAVSVAKWESIIRSQQSYSSVPEFAFLQNIGPPTAAVAAGSSRDHLAAAAAAGGGSSSSSASSIEMPSAVMWVWAGLVMLMIMRALTILLPLLLRCYPFTSLYTDKHQQQQQRGSSSSASWISKIWIKRSRSKDSNPAAAAAAEDLKVPLIAVVTDATVVTSTAAAAAGSSPEAGSHMIKSAITDYEIISSRDTETPDIDAISSARDHLIVVCGASPCSGSSSSSGGLLSSSYGSSSSDV